MQAPLPEWAPHMNHTQWSTQPEPFSLTAIADEIDGVFDIGAPPREHIWTLKVPLLD